MLWGLLLAGLGYLLLPATNETRHAVSKTILDTLSPKALLGLLIAIGLIAFALAILLWEAKSKPRLLAKYEFDERLGIRRHKKTGKLVCPQCLQKDGVEAGLKNEVSAWRCEVQPGHYFSNPDYQPPPNPKTAGWT